jgi:mycofactocin system FadH/OYE family oxidoreductase 2
VLSSPLQVGPLRLRNRLVFPAHLTGLATDGLPTAQHAAYYAARAAGGVGLVITEEHSVAVDDRPYEKLIRGHDPAVLPGYRLLTAAVHAHNVPVLAQLNHNGGQSSGRYSRAPVRAPSPVPDPLFREVPVELTVAEITGLVAAYADVAARCVAGGFDGVEVQCSQASLLRQFLSPLTNFRTDGYGGPLEHRVRIVREVAKAVREAIGPDRLLGVRLCGDEGLPGGVTLDEAVATARLLEPDVDLINTSVGVATATLHMVEPPLPVPPGYALGVAAAIRCAVEVPVIGVGRITDLADAERALAQCDLVGVARGQIADPAFARGPTRRCVACNQECAGRVGRNQPLTCVVNPASARSDRGRVAPLRLSRSGGRTVLVVGGGPAGLSAAAAVEAERVIVCERASELGGQVRLAARAPTRGGLITVVDDLAAECAQRGVEVWTGVEAGLGLVRHLAPDVIVLATGAEAALPTWARGWERVVDVRDVLAGRASPSGAVLVYDELGFHPATSTAELLAARGAAVEIMTPGMVVGQDLGLTLDMPLFHRRAQAAGITFATDRVIIDAAPGEVTVLHHLTGRIERRRCDWVVTAVPPRPSDALWSTLRGGPVPVFRIGDCVAPRRIDAAVREGEALRTSVAR